jgi:predicted membrane protein
MSLFGSSKQAGRFSVPAELQLKAAFGELKLDLREALFPEKHILLVAESLCASVEVLLPEGVTVVDHSTSLFSSHKLAQEGEEHGPVIHLDGWSICSDVKFLSAPAAS